MGAREKLAAIRAARETAAPVAAAPVQAAPQPTGARAKLAEIRAARPVAEAAAANLKRMDPTISGGAEVKRRANEGEPIVQTGLRAGTRGEQMGALGIDAVTGVAEGLGGMVGLAADAGADILTAGPVRRGARVALKKLRGEQVLPEDLAPPMKGSALATAAADDFRETARRVTGLEGVEIGPVGPVVRFGADVLTPGPEAVVAARDLRAGAKAAGDGALAREISNVPPELSTVHSGADLNVPERITTPDPIPAFTPEEAALAEQAGAAQAIAREPRPVSVGVRGEPLPPQPDFVEMELARGRESEARKAEPIVTEPVQPVNAERSSAVAARMRAEPVVTDSMTSPAKASEPPPATPPPEPPRTPPPSSPDGSGGAIPPEPIPKFARPSAINLERQNVPDEVKRWVVETTKATDDPVGGNIAGQLEELKGAPLTHQELRDGIAKGRLLTDPIARDASAQTATDMLYSRQILTEMETAATAGKLDPQQLREYLDLQRAVSTHLTDHARQLNAAAIRVGGEVPQSALRELTEQLTELGKTSDEIVEALKDVDFSDPAQAAAAYNAHIKPKFGNLLDAYRYTNLLSSLRTHIVNATSNVIQAAIVRPADLLASGAVDWIGSKLTGKAQTRYVSDVAPYYRGMLSAYPRATKAFMDVMTGRAPIEHLDMARAQAQEALPGVLKVIPRLLDGIDRFSVKLIEGGEFERIAAAAKKSGQTFNEVEAAKTAMANAREYAFRKPLDVANESGHGALLSTVDEFTSRVSHVLNTKVGGTQPLRWAVPFIQTPMNIFKSGIEHSPLGFATLYKSTRKTEQLGKAIVGSTVFMGAGMLAMDDRTTWAAPRNAKEKAAFYAAGMQPYAVKIGDTWISYTKLGPLAYPIALAAAMKYQAQDNPEASGRADMAFAGRMIGSLAEFFSDQSYMQGIGDIVNTAEGSADAIQKTISNFASQLIPLSSLQRWVTQIIDPVYRKSSRDLSVSGIMQNLKRNMPFLSEDVPPQLTPSGEESSRQMPFVNAVSPFGITVEDPEGARAFKEWMNMRRETTRARRADTE